MYDKVSWITTFRSMVTILFWHGFSFKNVRNSPRVNPRRNFWYDHKKITSRYGSINMFRFDFIRAQVNDKTGIL